MKKVLAALLVASSIAVIGCGSGGEGTEMKAGGQAAKPAQLPTGEKAKSSIADPTPVPAPPGVKTGTPGG